MHTTSYGPEVYTGHCARCEYGRGSCVFDPNPYGVNFSGVITPIRKCTNPAAKHTKVCPGCDTALRRQQKRLAQLCAAAASADNDITLPDMTAEMTEPIPSSNLPLTEVNAIETVNVSPSVRRSTRQRRPVDRDKMPTVERSTELTLPFIDFTSNAMQSPQSPRTPKRRKLNSAEPQSSPKTPASKRKRWKEPPPLYVQLRRFKHLLAESTEYSFDMMDVDGDGNCFFHAVVDQLTHGKKTIEQAPMFARDYHQNLRKQLCEVTEDFYNKADQGLELLKINVPEFQFNSIKEYVDKMSEAGTWATAVELHAFTNS
jgi:hypothetical protein